MGDEETMNMLCGGRLFIGIGADVVQVAPITKVDFSDAPLTCKDGDGLYRKPKGFSATCDVSISGDTESVIADIARQFNNADCIMETVPSGKYLPRKMKKALRVGSRYRRDTKWKRKAVLWQKRSKTCVLGKLNDDGDGNFTFTENIQL